jgi:tetratricopeptide (TPR) repeat protein
MKHCPQCQSKYEDRYGFCLKDGAALFVAQAGASRIFVPIEAEQVEPLASTAAKSDRPASTAPWYQNRLLLGGIAAGLLLVMGLGLYLLLRSNTAAKLEEAITKNNLLSPPGANAYELYHQLKTEGASREKLAQFESKILPLVTLRPEAMLHDLTTPGGEEPRVEEWADAAKLLEWANEMRGNDQSLAARAAYCQGRVAYLNNRRSEALDIWQRAHDMDKSWAVPANSLGLMYNENKDYSTARTYLFQAIERASGWTIPYNNIGTSYYYENNFDQAAYYYEKAIEYDSKWARPHAWLGSIAMKQGDCNRAASEFEQVLSSNATGTEKMDLGKIQQALDKARGCAFYE